MPYNVNRDSGFAERQSWLQVDDSIIPALTGSEGTTGIPKDKRFASLVYSVNPSQISISGATINVDTVGIDDSGDVQLEGDQLKVHDQDVLDAINAMGGSVTYSTVIQGDAVGNTYIAEANVGTSYSTDSWRVQKIDTDGSITWVDGANFSQAANIALSGLTYNP